MNFDIVKEIVDHYKNAVAERGRPFKETFIDPFTQNEVPNSVTVPVVLLNKLVDTFEKKVEGNSPWNLVWNHLDPHGFPWGYERGDLCFGMFEVGHYSRWADESLRRDGLSLRTPIRAWVNQRSFVDGKFNDKPMPFFATEAEAKAFVEKGVIEMFNDANC